jgi:hypothetical protein
MLAALDTNLEQIAEPLLFSVQCTTQSEQAL